MGTEDYNENLNKLRLKCIRSNFNLKFSDTQLIFIQKKYSTTSEKKQKKKFTGNKDNKNVYCSSQFKKILKISKWENKLFPSGNIQLPNH